ncbi:hypothetical protein [Pilimelia columellifera]|uniref:Uncharacterized protein n=1 Tax=Pilimelia columellifera subsp. columellifera TaxID=706583 RepID=A0ABN3NVB4_9ACTN
MWAQIRSYLIDAQDLPAWEMWADGKNWHGRWMPESGSPTGLLLADHPYEADWPNLEGRNSTPGEGATPGALTVTTTRYGGVSDWDRSDSKHLYTYMPSTALCTALNLNRTGEFQWGRGTQTLAESFAARGTGPDTVHVEAGLLGSALAASKQCLMWTILAAKETTMPHHRWPEDGAQVSRIYSASYAFDGINIRRLDANARTLLAGGGETNPARWSLPSTIPI